MQITGVGSDLVKNVLQVRGAISRRKPVLGKLLRRDQFAAFLGNPPFCLVGMEVRGGTHHWVLRIETFGHSMKFMGPQFVKPYVKINKTDMADGEAICELWSSHPCGSSRSLTSSGRPCWQYVGFGWALLKRPRLSRTAFEGYWRNSAWCCGKAYCTSAISYQSLSRSPRSD